MMINYSNAYATALFDIGKANNQIDKYFSQIQTLFEILNHYPDFNNFLNNLNIEKEQRKMALNDIFRNKLDPEIINWLFVIVDNYRTSILVEIIKTFLKKCDTHFKILFLKIYSAFNLEKSQLERIKIIFEKKYQSQVIVINQIDHSCIGGIKLEFDSKTYDGTIKGKIENIKNKNLKNNFQEGK